MQFSEHPSPCVVSNNEDVFDFSDHLGEDDDQDAEKKEIRSETNFKKNIRLTSTPKKKKIRNIPNYEDEFTSFEEEEEYFCHQKKTVQYPINRGEKSIENEQSYSNYIVKKCENVSEIEERTERNSLVILPINTKLKFSGTVKWGRVQTSRNHVSRYVLKSKFLNT